jgi:hypothetical protein
MAGTIINKLCIPNKVFKIIKSGSRREWTIFNCSNKRSQKYRFHVFHGLPSQDKKNNYMGV